MTFAWQFMAHLRDNTLKIVVFEELLLGVAGI
jgi:hypothetical protein